jgi:hypothetical protein
VELLLITVGIAVTPEGSEVLPSKDHRKFGEGKSDREVIRLSSKRVDEHVSEYASPAAGAVEPGEGEMIT